MATPVRGAAIDGSQDNRSTMPAGGTRPVPEGVALEELKKPPPAPQAPPGYEALTFERLSAYEYEIDAMGRVGNLADGTRSEVPQELLDFNGKKIAVSGFMVPLSLEATRVTDFVLVRNQLLCCYGQTPKMNEWVYVALEEPTEVQLDLPVTVAGDFYVGEDMEGDQVLSLYRMMGQKVEVIE